MVMNSILSSQKIKGGESVSECATLPTLDHLELSDFDHVYEPAEDTFLLCDALHQQRQELMELQPLMCVEIGCGSGCVITYLGQLLQSLDHTSFALLATDINPHALRCTSKTARVNKVPLEAVRSSLLSGLDARLSGCVDVLLFNPPYVPTPDDEVSGCGIEASWAGGEDGRRVIDQVLPMIKGLLSPRGCLYMILVKENKPSEIAKFCEENGLASEIVIMRRAKNEGLMVMKVSHCSA